MNYFRNLLVAGSAVALLAAATPAMAECTGAKNETAAVQKTGEIVAQTKTDPGTGDREAVTGEAKPEENWFGCKPEDKDFDKCVSEKGKQQEREAAKSADSGKAAEKPAGQGAENATPPAKTAAGDCPGNRKPS